MKITSGMLKAVENAVGFKGAQVTVNVDNSSLMYSTMCGGGAAYIELSVESPEGCRVFARHAVHPSGGGAPFRVVAEHLIHDVQAAIMRDCFRSVQF